MRHYLVGASVLLAGLSAVRAEDLKGTVSSVDAKNSRIVLQIDGKSRSFEVLKDATIVSQGEGSKKKAAQIAPVPNGLSGVKAGSKAEVRTEDQDGKQVVTSLKVEQSTATANTAPATKPAVKTKVKPNGKKNALRKNGVRKTLKKPGAKGIAKKRLARRVKK